MQGLESNGSFSPIGLPGERRLKVLLRSSPSSVSIVPLLRNISFWGDYIGRVFCFLASLPHSAASRVKTLRFHSILWYHIPSQARSALLTPFVAVHVTNLHLSGATSPILSLLSPPRVRFRQISTPSSNIDPDSDPTCALFSNLIPATLRAIQLTSRVHDAATTHAVLKGFLAFDSLPAIHTIALSTMSKPSITMASI
jgi:hypothetical protein